MEWQPIETAPTDFKVWAFNGEHGVMQWSEGDGWALWIWSDETLADIDPEPEQPTHWMPLPAAPLPAGYKTDPCNGMNCGCTDGVSHSPECLAQTAATYAGGYFVKAGVVVDDLDIPGLKCAAQAMTPIMRDWIMRVLDAFESASAAPQPAPATGDDIPDPHNGVEAVIACLGDDAATLREDYPEIADNMDRAAELLAAHHSQPLDMVSTGDEPTPAMYEAAQKILFPIGGEGDMAPLNTTEIRRLWLAMSAAHRSAQPIDMVSTGDEREALNDHEAELLSAIKKFHTHDFGRGPEIHADAIADAYKKGRAAHRREDQREYTKSIGDAGQAYMDTFTHAHPLPAQFRWQILWDVMNAAMQRTAAPAQTDGCIVCGSNGNGCPHCTPGY